MESGEVPIEVLDARVRTVLELVDQGHARPRTRRVVRRRRPPRARPRSRRRIGRAAHNDGVLPLTPDASIAVIGEFARTPRFQGAGSSQVNPIRIDMLLDELRAAYGEVPFAAGYGIGEHHRRRCAAGRGRAGRRLCRHRSVVVGLPGADESEGFDRTHMNLPANQLAVLQAVAAVNPNVVVVLVNGSTVLLGDVTPHARHWSRPGWAVRPPGAESPTC